MNRSIATILLTACFTILFYQHGIGVNSTIYGVLTSTLAAFVIFLNGGNWKQTALATLPLLIASATMGIYGNQLNIFMAFAAFGLLGATIAHKTVDPVSAIGMSMVNFIISPIRMLQGGIRFKKIDSALQKKLLSYVLLPLCFVALFSIFYAAASPVFESLLERIDWNILNARLLWTILLGALFSTVAFKFFVFPFYRNLSFQTQKTVEEVDNNRTDLLPNTWTIIFFTLSALLMLVISSEVYYRFVLNEMPAGLSRASYLHRGILSLIASILLAIGLIAFVFQRTATKFEKIGATVFMFLNLTFILLNAEKNSMYIFEYGMTIKRLGVYLYLFMTAIGALLTLGLIFGKWNLTKLIKLNSHSIFYCLVLFSCFHWPRIITRHNLSHKPAESGMVDIDYLLTFGNSNLDILMDEVGRDLDDERLEYRINSFRTEYEQNDFLSTSLFDHIIYKRINQNESNAE